MQDESNETEINEFVATTHYISKTDDEIKSIAKGIYKNEIFSSMQINDSDSHLILNIFLPLAFLDPINRKQLITDNITHFYGHITQSSGAINGYPILFEAYQLNQEDASKVISEIKKIIEVLGD